MLVEGEEKDLTREEMEAALMGTEVQEPDEPEVTEPVLDTEAPETPEESAGPTIQELQEKLSKLEAENESRRRAIEEERTRRKGSEDTLRLLLDRLETAKQAPAAPQEEDIPDEEKYVAQLIAKYAGPHIQRLQQMEQQMQASTQQQRMMSDYQVKLNSYVKTNPDFNNAVQFFGQRIRDRAALLFPDDYQNQVNYVNSQVMAAHSVEPATLYEYVVKTEGYNPQSNTNVAQPAQPAAQPAQTRPVKSLSNVAGGTPGTRESLQARAERLLNAESGFEGLMKADRNELEDLLKEITPR